MQQNAHVNQAGTHLQELDEAVFERINCCPIYDIS
jgi:hypothetical protein